MNRQAIPEMIGWCRRLGYEVGYTDSQLEHPVLRVFDSIGD